MDLTTFHASLLSIYSLFMCQEENENEDENQSFGSCVTNEPFLQCIIELWEHTISINKVGRRRGKEKLEKYGNYVLSERSREGG